MCERETSRGPIQAAIVGVSPTITQPVTRQKHIRLPKHQQTQTGSTKEKTKLKREKGNQLGAHLWEESKEDTVVEVGVAGEFTVDRRKRQWYDARDCCCR